MQRARRSVPRLAGARIAIALALSGCSKPERPALAGAAPAAVAEGRASNAAQLLPPAGAPTASSAPAPGARELPCSAAAGETGAFTKIHAGAVLSAAVGTPPRAAVWSGELATLFEAGEPRALPAPRLPPGAKVEIFFGRDNQPRLMGFVPGEPGKEVPVYLRFRQGTFRPEPSELGPLGAPRGALYGVLGFDDPEVVCRPRELCLVKRVTGWGRVPAHDEPVRVVLRGAGVFALHADRIERLGERGWSSLDPGRTFERPLDVWQAPNGELWVVDRSEAGVFRLAGGRWESVASPVRQPRAIFGRSASAVFVVGDDGAAELDGARFRCLGGLPGPLHLALAVGDDLWLAGQSGLFRRKR